MAEPKLTKKQQQVFKLLGEGLDAQEIAKKMRVSRSAVYGHISRMKEKGVTVAQPEGDAGSANGRSSNGDAPSASAARPFDVDDGFAADIAEVEERTRTAIEEIDARAHTRLSEIQAERTTLHERLEFLDAAERSVNIAVQRAKAVEEALV